MASLRLFGVPRWGTYDDALTLPTSKPVALLLYLAVRADWVGRNEAALLFWPESDASRAHHALRQLVYRARRLPWAMGVEATERYLRWRVVSDVQDFRRGAAASDWAGAANAYRGPFLEAFDVPDAAGFTAWVEVERDALQRAYLGAALRAAAALEARRGYAAAADVLEAAWQQDPLSTEVAIGLMRCLALDGRTAASLDAFERHRAHVAEAGGAPDLAAAEIAAQLRRGTPPPPRPHNLVGQSTPFVGRERELRDIARRLADPACRLLTLVGPGGIGKTRLAQQAAAHQVGAFRDGVFVAELASVDTEGGMAAAIAEAMGGAGVTGTQPEARLLAALRDVEVLLVLDNLDELVGCGRWLGELLRRAPGVTLLATSRQPLGIAAEWQQPVAGLELPPPDDDLSVADSVLLFAQAAERVRPGIADEPGARRDVARICRFVDGVPLAIELAAAWTQVLTPAEIADQVELDLGFLRSEGGDLPERHASMRAVFASSWARLGESERVLAMRLAVFAGEIETAAVEAVAGPCLATLRGLVRSSMARPTAAGACEMHPLVRQFVREQWASWPELAADARLRHARHVAEAAAACRAGDAEGGLERLGRLLPDAELAWRTLVERRAWGALATLLPTVSEIHDVRARSVQFLSWLEAAIAAEPDDPVVLGRLLAHLGGCLQRLGRNDEAEHAVERAIDLLPVDPPAFERCLALRVRGNVAYQRGEPLAAATAYQTALHVAERLDDPRHLAGCHNNLGLAYKQAGDLASALAHLQRARRLSAAGDPAIHSQVLNNLATVQARLGAPDEAEPLLRQSAALKRELGDDRGLASVLTNLGNLRARAGDAAAAERYHREALAVAETIQDASGTARAFTNLADLAFAGDDLDAAAHAYRRGLAIKRGLGEHAGTVEAYLQLSECARRRADLVAAAAALQEARAYVRSCGCEDRFATQLSAAEARLGTEADEVSTDAGG